MVYYCYCDIVMNVILCSFVFSRTFFNNIFYGQKKKFLTSSDVHFVINFL